MVPAADLGCQRRSRRATSGSTPDQPIGDPRPDRLRAYRPPVAAMTLPAPGPVPARRALGHVGVARHPPPPRQLGGLADADPARRRRDASGGATPSSTDRSPRSPVTRSAPSSVAGDAEGLAQLGRAAASASRSVVTPGPRPGRMAGEPGTGARARSSTAWPSPRAADDVGAPVHPVGEIDVEVARAARTWWRCAGSGPGRRGTRGPRSPGRPRPRRSGPPGPGRGPSTAPARLFEQIAGATVERGRRRS